MMRILSSSLVLALLSIMVMLELPLTVQPLLAAVIRAFRSGLDCAGPSWGHLWQMLMDGFHCDGSQRLGLLWALLGPFWPIQVDGFHCDGLHMHATCNGPCMVIRCDALLPSQFLDLQSGFCITLLSCAPEQRS